MRHYIYILCSFCIALATLSSCAIDDMFNGKNDSESNGKIVLNCSAVFPGSTVDTKTLGEATSTTIKSLYLVIFDENGNLLEIDKAVPGTYNIPNDTFTPDGNAENETVFHVEVTPSSSTKRIIHFVANYDVIHANLGAEYDVMNKMYTANGNDAYWQRVEVPSLTDQTHFTRIPLIRNFAKITLSIGPTASDFHITGYFLYNMYNSGSVAPFNINTSIDASNRFAQYYKSDGTQYKYSEMISSATGSQHYTGCEPGNVAISNPDVSDETSAALWKGPTEASYVYENTYKPNDLNYPYIIIRGYKGSTPMVRYYKADFSYTLTDVSTNVKTTTHYNLLRNYHYTMQITKVDSDGSTTLSGAMNGLPMNDILGAATSADINNISASQQHLYVNLTDEMVVSTAPIEIKYKNVINTDPNYNTVDNDYVINGATTEDIPVLISGLTGEVVSSNNYSIAASNDDDGSNYRTITIIPNAPIPNRVLKQVITITNQKGLSRTVTLTLRPPLVLGLSCTPETATSLNDDIDLKLSIPANLSKYRFPMEFNIESDKKNVYPNSSNASYAEMPVVVGKSIVTGNTTKNSYSFKRIISFEEYEAAASDANGNKVLDCHFSLYKSTNGTTTFYVKSGKYFDGVTYTQTFTVNI